MSICGPHGSQVCEDVVQRMKKTLAEQSLGRYVSKEEVGPWGESECRQLARWLGTLSHDTDSTAAGKRAREGQGGREGERREVSHCTHHL